MIKYLLGISVTFILLISLSMCDTISSSDDELEVHTLTVNVNPGNAGSVTPDGGSYESGEEVTLTASPNNGWEFDNWSGDKSSSSNPLTITIQNDVTLTANFAESQDPDIDKFEGNMIVSDGLYSRDLEFGILDNAVVKDGLDNNDKEGPPIAPPDAFFTGFKVNELTLYKDFRSASENVEEVVWGLVLSHGGNGNLELSWSINASINGTLKLLDKPDDSNASVNVDMKNESTYLITNPTLSKMFIVYSKSQTQNTITNIDSKIHQNIDFFNGEKLDQSKSRENIESLRRKKNQ